MASGAEDLVTNAETSLMIMLIYFPRWPRRPGEAPRRHPDMSVRGSAGDVGDAAAVGNGQAREPLSALGRTSSRSYGSDDGGGK
jgi:hypothetical protein